MFVVFDSLRKNQENRNLSHFQKTSWLKKSKLDLFNQYKIVKYNPEMKREEAWFRYSNLSALMIIAIGTLAMLILLIYLT